MKKRVILEIDKNYASKYNLENSFVGKKILYFEDRNSHILRHKHEFINEESFNYSFENLDNIIKNPEFIYKDEKNNSLLFVKRMIDNTLVAVRISESSNLKVRTMYPINDSKKNRLKK